MDSVKDWTVLGRAITSVPYVSSISPGQPIRSGRQPAALRHLAASPVDRHRGLHFRRRPRAARRRRGRAQVAPLLHVLLAPVRLPFCLSPWSSPRLGWERSPWAPLRALILPAHARAVLLVRLVAVPCALNVKWCFRVRALWSTGGPGP